MGATLLIADDEPDILAMLNEYFTMDGYTVLTAACGEEAVRKAASGPDLILLDIGLPDLDGLAVCRRIRDFVSCPILFLTARVEQRDKILGFGAGADDYIVKPFSIEELGARVAAHLRREKRQRRQTRVRFSNELSIDYGGMALYFRTEPVPLAKKEYDIVEFLSQNAGRVFSREQIYEQVWAWDSAGDSAVVAEHIRRIRQKLAAAGAQNPIETVWGFGYKWSR